MQRHGPSVCACEHVSPLVCAEPHLTLWALGLLIKDRATLVRVSEKFCTSPISDLGLSEQGISGSPDLEHDSEEIWGSWWACFCDHGLLGILPGTKDGTVYGTGISTQCKIHVIGHL